MNAKKYDQKFRLCLVCSVCSVCVRYKISKFSNFLISENDKNNSEVKLYMFTSSSQNFICVFFVCSVCSVCSICKMTEFQIVNISENGNKYYITNTKKCLAI